MPAIKKFATYRQSRPSPAGTFRIGAALTEKPGKSVDNVVFFSCLREHASGALDRAASAPRLGDMLRSSALAIACWLCLSATGVSAGAPIKTCFGLEVRSIGVSAESERQVLLETAREGPELVPTLIAVHMPGAAENAATIIAVGPVLGSMDSREVKTDLACTPEGVAVTATITRSADFHGSVLKNVIWRPRIEVAIIRRQPEVIFRGTWKMRLTTGTELYHAQTPPYSDQRYPLTLTKSIQAE